MIEQGGLNTDPSLTLALIRCNMQIVSTTKEKLQTDRRRATYGLSGARKEN